MKIKIEISCNNAAFEDSGVGPEAANILRQLAEDIDFCGMLEESGDLRRLRDSNGNTCGLFETVED